MKASRVEKVLEMYEGFSESYAAMMDVEIDLPMYADLLDRLAARIASVPGPVIDTSCGPGHVLQRYRERYDSERPLVAVDLSPRMVEMARDRLGAGGTVLVGDMRDLRETASDAGAAVLSFFAIHHLDPEGVQTALDEWQRVLRAGGQLVVAAWEGVGPIDYGGESDIVALRYTQKQLVDWVGRSGFEVDRCSTDPVEGMPMDAVYLEGTKR